MSVTLNRRSKVLLTLVACMTLGSGLLLALAGDPVQQVQVPLAGVNDRHTPAPPTQQVGIWQRIVIHSSRTTGGSLEQFERDHDRAFGGCAYHFVVGPDGTVHASRRWERQEPAPADADGSTVPGIQVVLIGRFDHQPPAPEQLLALQSLIRKLTADYRIPRDQVKLHSQVEDVAGAKDCPGPSFPAAWLFDGPAL